MNNQHSSPNALQQALGTLRPMLRQPQRDVERCEYCGEELSESHSHLVNVVARSIHCCCDACAVFEPDRNESSLKRVPWRVVMLEDFQLSDEQWEELCIPINIALLFFSTPAKRMIALYPSPGGAVESLLPISTWDQLLAANPGLAEMQSDVQALLVNRLGERRGFARHEYFIAPIDLCFELVGLIRTHWRGLSGGTQVWDQMRFFFDRLRQRSCGHTSGLQL